LGENFVEILKCMQFLKLDGVLRPRKGTVRGSPSVATCKDEILKIKVKQEGFRESEEATQRGQLMVPGEPAGQQQLVRDASKIFLERCGMEWGNQLY
jgi:hypothetical protein